MIEKAGGAPAWGRKTGRSEERETKANEEEEDEEEGAPKSLLPRPPPGLKLNTV